MGYVKGCAYTTEELEIIDEKREVDEKRERLSTFTTWQAFAVLPPEDQALLLTQEVAMRQYSDTLGKRIARFTPALDASDADMEARYPAPKT